MRASSQTATHRYWDYKGYFDLDAQADADGYFVSEYAIGGSLTTDSQTPFIIHADQRVDQLPATMRMRVDASSILEIRCSTDTGGVHSMQISYVDPDAWNPAPLTLPGDTDAYRLVPLMEDGPIEVRFDGDGHVAVWRENESNPDEDRVDPVIYAVRVVDELPAEAFSPADLNRDGEVDFIDVSMFLDLYHMATN